MRWLRQKLKNEIFLWIIFDLAIIAAIYWVCEYHSPWVVLGCK